MKSLRTLEKKFCIFELMLTIIALVAAFSLAQYGWSVATQYNGHDPYGTGLIEGVSIMAVALLGFYVWVEYGVGWTISKVSNALKLDQITA